MSRQMQIAVRDDASGTHQLTEWMTVLPDTVVGFDDDLNPVAMDASALAGMGAGGISDGSGAPSGSTSGLLYIDSTNRNLYLNVAGEWILFAEIP
jgi:hypothetical protein